MTGFFSLYGPEKMEEFVRCPAQKRREYRRETSGEDGTIEPTGTMLVARGESKDFTITADSGYRIADVTVNSKSVGAVGRARKA